MMLLTQDQRKRLIANGQSLGDHVPIVKFFNPIGAATWLLSELDEAGFWLSRTWLCEPVRDCNCDLAAWSVYRARSAF